MAGRMARAVASISVATAAMGVSILAAATPAYAAAATVAGGWDIHNLMAKIKPIIAILFPILMFVAVIRIMWAGLGIMTGGAAGGEIKNTPKKVLTDTVQGLLWIMGAWILVTLAFSLAENVIK